MSWGLTYEANQDNLYEIEPIHGPGIYQEEKRELRSSRDLDFLDPDYWKQRLSPKVKKAISKVARQAIKQPKKPTQDAHIELEKHDYVADLITLLERENIAFKRFYADLLNQQMEAQRLAQIRLQFEMLGIYQRIEEEDEQAIMLMMMEL